MSTRTRTEFMKNVRKEAVKELCKYRHEEGLTYRELVERAGMSSSQYFFNIEHGISIPSMRFLLQLEKGIGKILIPSKKENRQPGEMVSYEEF